MDTREQFEAWIGERGWGIQKVNGFYDDPFTHDAWSAWNASRASVEIELPGTIGWDGYPGGELMRAADVHKAVEAAGVKVKPC